MKLLKLVTIAVVYGFFMWSAGWVSVRIYDSNKLTVASKTNEPETTTKMLELINQEREKAGLAEVYFDYRAANAAKLKACDMRDRGYFSHKDPEGRFGWHFLTESKVSYDDVGENIAKNQGSPDPVKEMEEFMKSKTHREIILDARYATVGYASCGQYTVQYFVR